MNFCKSVLILTSTCTVVACSPVTTSPSEQQDAAADELTIERNILALDRNSLGTVSLRDLGVGGTEVTVNISGLEGAGIHAVHFHEKGSCDAPDYSSAGGHYNPTNMQHGMMRPDGPHAGDMMNIDVNSNGSGTFTMVNDRVSINGDHGLPALFDEDGSALIIHAKADDYTTQPSGAAGARIACAVLEAN